MKITAVVAAVALLGCLALLVAGNMDLELADANPSEESHIDIGEVEIAESPNWQGFQYGRVTATDGQVFEGRLRWGRTQEAFWGDHFNGDKSVNPWTDDAPQAALMETRPRNLFGVNIGSSERKRNLDRPFVARFGDLARIDVDGRNLRATLKSGTQVELDRMADDDIGDGVRIWTGDGDTVDLIDRAIRQVEFLPNPNEGAGPGRLHGTLTTDRGSFTGYIEWNRRASLGPDVLEGRGVEGKIHLHFETIRAIAKQENGALVTLLDGQQMLLDQHPDVDDNNRGVVVDDPRFGRVTVDWSTFRRADFSPAGSGPAYDDFPPGWELTGSVTLRSAEGYVEGRLVFDMDESESTDTLDVHTGNIHYSIPFGLVASMAVPEDETKQIALTLHDETRLKVDRSGDLSGNNGGLLVFAREAQPTYVPWSDLEHIDFDQPPASLAVDPDDSGS